MLEADADEICTQHDHRGVIRFVSNSLTELAGYELAALLGRRGDDFVHDDDLSALISAVRTAPHDDEGPTTLFRIRSSDGSFVWLDGRFRKAIGDSGKFELVCTARPVAVSAFKTAPLTG